MPGTLWQLHGNFQCSGCFSRGVSSYYLEPLGPLKPLDICSFPLFFPFISTVFSMFFL